MVSRKRIATLLTAAALCALAVLPLAAQGRSDELVRLRFVGDKESATVEVPLAVLEFLNRHNVGRKVHTGTVNGQKVTLSLDKLVQSLKDNRGKTGETLIFTAEEHGRTTSCYAGFVTPAPRPGKTPVNVVLTVKDLKAATDKTKLTVPLSTVDAVLQALNIEGEQGGDLGGLFKQCVQFANELGTGMLARAVGPTEEVLLSLE